MKKIIYILMIAVVTSLTVTSCTEEAVAPANETANGGGGTSADPLNK